jgi:hypothetical protein
VERLQKQGVNAVEMNKERTKGGGDWGKGGE